MQMEKNGLTATSSINNSLRLLRTDCVSVLYTTQSDNLYSRTFDVFLNEPVRLDSIALNLNVSDLNPARANIEIEILGSNDNGSHWTMLGPVNFQRYVPAFTLSSASVEISFRYSDGWPFVLQKLADAMTGACALCVSGCACAGRSSLCKRLCTACLALLGCTCLTAAAGSAAGGRAARDSVTSGWWCFAWLALAAVAHWAEDRLPYAMACLGPVGVGGVCCRGGGPAEAGKDLRAGGSGDQCQAGRWRQAGTRSGRVCVSAWRIRCPVATSTPPHKHTCVARSGTPNAGSPKIA